MEKDSLATAHQLSKLKGKIKIYTEFAVTFEY